MKTATKFLTERYGNNLNSFADNVEALEIYAKMVLENAAEKATISQNYYPKNQQLNGRKRSKEFILPEYSYFVTKDSILNSLK